MPTDLKDVVLRLHNIYQKLLEKNVNEKFLYQVAKLIAEILDYNEKNYNSIVNNNKNKSAIILDKKILYNLKANVIFELYDSEIK